MSCETKRITKNKNLTSTTVRDAIIECFFEAHKEILDKKDEFYSLKSKEELEHMKHKDVEMLVEALFEETGGDFKNPDKESLFKVVDELKKYASKFRSPAIIKKHALEMKDLIEKIKGN